MFWPCVTSKSRKPDMGFAYFQNFHAFSTQRYFDHLPPFEERDLLQDCMQKLDPSLENWPKLQYFEILHQNLLENAHHHYPPLPSPGTDRVKCHRKSLVEVPNHFQLGMSLMFWLYTSSGVKDLILGSLPWSITKRSYQLINLVYYLTNFVLIAEIYQSCFSEFRE